MDTVGRQFEPHLTTGCVCATARRPCDVTRDAVPEQWCQCFTNLKAAPSHGHALNRQLNSNLNEMAVVGLGMTALACA